MTVEDLIISAPAENPAPPHALKWLRKCVILTPEREQLGHIYETAAGWTTWAGGDRFATPEEAASVLLDGWKESRRDC